MPVRPEEKIRCSFCGKNQDQVRKMIAGSNVLRFEMADGTSVIVRPPGTEPKIKVYVLTQGKDAADAAANVEKYGKWVDTLKK